MSSPRSALASPSTSAGRITLDTASAAWFSAVCAGEHDLQKRVRAVPAAPDVATAKTVFEKAYLGLAASSRATRIILAKLAPPRLPGVDGASVKTHRLAQFVAVTNGYQAGAAALRAAGVETAPQVNKAINAVEQNVQNSVVDAAVGAPVVPAAYRAVADQLPACRA